ncbi:GIY-YIG nuclease family protein [Cyclobacterium sp.]|uniref:GIY-YIG nuclease family protein n=1 Tax=Cyclobacterium sp. TaxID=1966343 RepID=UPI0019848C2F|nr:GIY-YIG nuclease family protein [Cyclobacterium sp.]MBD3631171.1 GIY-YIG nuclease family protein [Cyclobacterium sp.]
MTHYFYSIESEKDGSFYIGSSQDPVEGLKKHNRPHKGYTGRKQSWKLVHAESFETDAEAIIREKYLQK